MTKINLRATGIINESAKLLVAMAKLTHRLFLLVPLALVCGESLAQYKGDSILNLVEIGKDYKLEDIKEIKDFTALYIEREGELRFSLTLDGDVPLDHPDGGLSPTLVLNKDGDTLASVHLPVSRWGEKDRLNLEWRAVPHLCDESYCFIQLYPNLDNMVSLRIPFSVATIKRLDKDRKMHVMTLDEVKKLAHQQRKKKEQEDAGASEVDDESRPGERRVKRIMISPKSGSAPTRVTLHTFEVGVFDAEGKFKPAKVMPYKIGAEFGYELEVYSPQGKVHVKEVLDLPAPGIWNAGSEIDEVELEGVKLLDVRVENDNKTQIQEYELHSGKKSVAFGQVYEIAEGDPKGMYRFTIYLNGQLAETVELEVGNPQ